MKTLARSMFLALVGVVIGFGPACKKSANDPKVIEAASKLPGAADVWAAIEKKDYDGAVAAVVKVQQALTNEEQNVEFRVLAFQALQKLNEVAATNAQAAEAVNAVRSLTTTIR
jgi:predicted patatin/cPLA2 family phospholipase